MNTTKNVDMYSSIIILIIVVDVVIFVAVVDLMLI